MFVSIQYNKRKNNSFKSIFVAFIELVEWIYYLPFFNANTLGIRNENCLKLTVKSIFTSITISHYSRLGMKKKLSSIQGKSCGSLNTNDCFQFFFVYILHLCFHIIHRLCKFRQFWAKVVERFLKFHSLVWLVLIPYVISVHPSEKVLELTQTQYHFIYYFCGGFDMRRSCPLRLLTLLCSNYSMAFDYRLGAIHPNDSKWSLVLECIDLDDPQQQFKMIRMGTLQFFLIWQKMCSSVVHSRFKNNVFIALLNTCVGFPFKNKEWHA